MRTGNVTGNEIPDAARNPPSSPDRYAAATPSVHDIPSLFFRFFTGRIPSSGRHFIIPFPVPESQSRKQPKRKKTGPPSRSRFLSFPYSLIQSHSPLMIMLVFGLMWGFHSMIFRQLLMP